MKNFFILPIFLLLFIAPIFSQTNSALVGTVVDKDGAPVENVLVELLNTAFATRTDILGNVPLFRSYLWPLYFDC